MIKIYPEKKENTTKVFFVINKNKVTSVLVGNQTISDRKGIQFHVDDYVAEQIDKCELYIDGFTPKLKLKKGETLDVPTKESLKEKEIRELEQRLKRLKNAE